MVVTSDHNVQLIVFFFALWRQILRYRIIDKCTSVTATTTSVLASVTTSVLNISSFSHRGVLLLRVEGIYEKSKNSSGG